jgi:3-hydroxyisobutyrate dehydrogenase
VTKGSGSQAVGVIGLGQIGGGVAASLVRSGRPVWVYDAFPKMMERFKIGATIANSATEIGRNCDVVLIAVVNADQVEDVLAGANGLLAANNPALTVVVLSTIPVAAIRKFAKLGADHGVTVLDCGVTGGQKPAEAGTLVALLGGADADVEPILEILRDFSSLVLHMGPLGSGIKTKIARNLINYVIMDTAYEAKQIMDAAQLDFDKLIEAVRVSDELIGGNTAQMMRVRNGPIDPIARPELHRQLTALAGLAHKDLQAAVELARELGVEVPHAQRTVTHVDEMFGLTKEASRAVSADDRR